jgi:hypothetical protein
MGPVSEEVRTFLENTRYVEGRELDVAIVYAQSLADELQSVAEDWTAVAARLRGMKRGRVQDSSENGGN